jgi:hypothetical protein
MLKRWISGWMAVTLAGGLQGVFKSAQTEFQAAKPNVALVELFTSEGCSSCPPADDLLRRIDGSTTDQGLLIVGISEHVTYWDHDGWKDPYGSETMTERQNDYGRRFNLESVYTPQMVVNGEAEFVGSDGRSLVKAVTGARGATGSTVEIGSLTVDGASVAAKVSVGTLPSTGADMFAVVAEDETTQHVLRGENQGKTLSHASVARILVNVGRMEAPGTRAINLKLPSDVGIAPGTRRHLIVWLQEPNFGRVTGVDSKAF